MKGKLLLLAGLLMALATAAHAGASRGATSDPAFDDWGNRTRLISVAASTTSIVVLSTDAVSSNLGINEWRYRRIVNKGHGSVMLTWNPSDYAVYVATKGIVLGVNEYWEDFGSDAVYGIWIGTTTLTGGAAGVEKYFRAQ